MLASTMQFTNNNQDNQPTPPPNTQTPTREPTRNRQTHKQRFRPVWQETSPGENKPPSANLKHSSEKKSLWSEEGTRARFLRTQQCAQPTTAPETPFPLRHHPKR
ncbi:hypothetical protein GCM10010116_62100 [Microbispora rosea subsp. aerata]|nr:hypothetical protein GCM10010116_62100 [Microbispora rosea subsp. aerata]